MTRFVVDTSAVLYLVSAEIEVSDQHKLLAPTLLRSQTLSALHEAVHRGEISADVARDHLARIRHMPIRLLGDAVLRRRAWDLADKLGWASTYNAEYVALTQLQADALVTLNADLVRSVQGIIATASIDDLVPERFHGRLGVTEPGHDGAMKSDERLDIELDAIQRDVLVAGLNEWGGPARPTEELALAMSFSGLDGLHSDRLRLRDALEAGDSLSRLDWARVLLSTEIVFISDVVGSGHDWTFTVGLSDEDTIRLIREIQLKLTGKVRPLIGSQLGTEPDEQPPG